METLTMNCKPGIKYWSDEEIEALLSEYQKHPNLWDKNNPSYKNRASRTASLENIRSKFMVSSSRLYKKLKSLRDNYELELERIKNCDTPPYTPKFKYFYQLDSIFKGTDQLSSQKIKVINNHSEPLQHECNLLNEPSSGNIKENVLEPDHDPLAHEPEPTQGNMEVEEVKPVPYNHENQEKNNQGTNGDYHKENHEILYPTVILSEFTAEQDSCPRFDKDENCGAFCQELQEQLLGMPVGSRIILQGRIVNLVKREIYNLKLNEATPNTTKKSKREK